MTKVVNMNPRGTITLPKAMRRRFESGPIIAEETEAGILLRPCITISIELYTEKRLAEFQKHNETALSGLRVKKKK